ncbi:MAG: UDP-N-acetylglucosamine--N-acetylmuramyl-(pentapeptide) pyrophosphoryl-undecaprenol N-acetylglucosamine transferase [Caldilineaceae bacterium]|nr:UDP-N-acetylglucosamine--N-acetylmuramyl-(pentapeptide) pyrophosphoryl-undecaprenol N-acetylglucosamine transferase [Caldilineaceae bacterium]
MRILISGGGTGGHVYPALAVVAQLPTVAKVAIAPPAVLAVPGVAPYASDDAAALLWVGASTGMEKGLVEHAGLPYRGIATGQLRGKDPATIIRSTSKMLKGWQDSLAILRDFQPDVCLATGGYVCAPVVMACRWQHIPVLIYLPDMVPGWAIRLLSRFADRVAVSYPEAARYFGGIYPTGKAVVTGYPVRQELVELAGDEVAGDEVADVRKQVAARRAARCQLATQLQRPLCTDDNFPLVMVWGGSQGSRNINEALWTALPQILPHAHVLHVVGERDWQTWQSKLQQSPVPTEQWQRYHPVAYLHEEMTLALAAADLTVARAGASTLGEFPVARLPAVLVPHPGVNQRQNAEYLVEHGGAVLLDDHTLAQQLAPTLLELIQDRTRRQRMEMALAKLAKPQAAQAIAEQLVQLAAQP